MSRAEDGLRNNVNVRTSRRKERKIMLKRLESYQEEENDIKQNT
jgi:hypothetical protein